MNKKYLAHCLTSMTAFGNYTLWDNQDVSKFYQLFQKNGGANFPFAPPPSLATALGNAGEHCLPNHASIFYDLIIKIQRPSLSESQLNEKTQFIKVFFFLQHLSKHFSRSGLG